MGISRAKVQPTSEPSQSPVMEITGDAPRPRDGKSFQLPPARGALCPVDHPHRGPLLLHPYIHLPATDHACVTERPLRRHASGPRSSGGIFSIRHRALSPYQVEWRDGPRTRASLHFPAHPLCADGGTTK
eukprot:1933913-Pyramimonas_sp.AAC.1